MRMSDWSSDVCSSDLAGAADREAVPGLPRRAGRCVRGPRAGHHRGEPAVAHPRRAADGAEQQVRRAGADYRQQERVRGRLRDDLRSEEHTSELQSLMRISYAVFCLKKKTNIHQKNVISLIQHI